MLDPEATKAAIASSKPADVRRNGPNGAFQFRLAPGMLPGTGLANLGNLANLPDYLSSSDDDMEDVPMEELNTPLFPLDDRPILGCAGGGVFFFWEVGVLKYLSERYRLQDMNLIGVSAGALASVLVACQVDLDRSVRRAYDICVERDIFNRPGGLQGVWGAILRQWLDELLPEDAHERCQGRVKIIATRMPRMKLVYLDEFATRDDVIDSLMASVHIPFFLDGNGSFTYKGEPYIDGSIFDFFFGNNSSLLTIDGRSEIIDYFYDDQLEFSRLDFVKLLTLETVNELIRTGYSYAERTDAKGMFTNKLGSCKKSGLALTAEGLGRRLWTRIGGNGS